MLLKEIHKDDRGTLWTLTHNNHEYLLMETNKGYSRGGDYHKSIQHDVVLSGVVVFTSIKDGIEKVKPLGVGDKITFEPINPHMVTSITDSLILEWLEGDFEKAYYEPYRKIIEKGKEKYPSCGCGE